MMRSIAVSVLLALGVALAGCTAGQGYQDQVYSGSSAPYGYGYGAPTSNQFSQCGALGTCPVTGLPALSPMDEHGY
jgi:hypothetical protein